MAAVTYELIKKDAKTKARRGRVTTPHGTIETPGIYAGRHRGYGKSHAAGGGKGNGGGDYPFQYLSFISAAGT